MPRKTRLQIEGDGRTVWINGPDGSCWARFSLTGIDIHYPVEIQMATGKQCMKCSHGMTNEADWDFFCQSVFELWGVKVPRSLRLKHLR